MNALIVGTLQWSFLYHTSLFKKLNHQMTPFIDYPLTCMSYCNAHWSNDFTMGHYMCIHLYTKNDLLYVCSKRKNQLFACVTFLHFHWSMYRNIVVISWESPHQFFHNATYAVTVLIRCSQWMSALKWMIIFTGTVWVLVCFTRFSPTIVGENHCETKQWV